MIINKSEVDLTKISKTYEDDRLPFEEYKDKFIKIAFDVYTPANDPNDELWVVQENDDGVFLTRSDWGHENVNVKESQDNDWDAVSNKEGNVITLYFKKQPLINLSSEEYGFKKDTKSFIKTLVKFMQDKDNVAKLLKELPEKKVAELKIVE